MDDRFNRILIVDDEPRVLQTLARNLELVGYRVLTAASGQEALRLYREQRPDLALVDVRMPEMDGFAVLAGIRALDAEAEVIQMTGHGDMETAIAALRAGASDFLPKPVDRQSLEAALHRARQRLLLKQELLETRETLQATEADYRTITETAFVGVLVTDLAETITFANAALAELLGYTPAELVGMSLAQLTLPEDFAFYREQTQRRRANLRDQYEGRLLRRDGRVLEVLISAAPLRPRGSQDITQSLNVVVDITERNRAERERDREARLNAAMAELAQQLLSAASLDDISDLVLQRAKELTGSCFGFVGFIDPATGHFVSATLSRDIWQGCQVPHKTFVFEHFKGLWGWMLTQRQPLLTNDPASDPRSGGVPDGHVAIERFLAVPALYQGELVGGVALANPPRDYTVQDQQVVERLADLYALAVQQQRAQSQLRSSEERFRQLVELAPDGLLSVDAQGRIVLVNAQVERLFGYRRDELVGRAVHELLPPALLEQHQQYCAQFIARPEARAMGSGLDLRARRKDGSEFPIDVSLGPVQTETGLLVICLIRDITERRQIEERLRLQSAALEAVANAVVITDAQGNIQWVNPAFTHLTGYTAAEAYGQNPRLLKSGVHPPAFYAELWQTVLAGQPWHGELINRRKDGQLYYEEMTIAPVTDAQGQIQHFVAIKQDITARKEAEAELVRSREQYMLAVNGSNDGIWDWDLRTGTLFLSPKWKQMIGYADDELPNALETFTERVHPDDSARVMAMIKEYLSGQNQTYSVEFRFRHRDGSYRWILARGEALRDEHGIPYRMAGSHTDITDRKAYEEALRQSRDELELRVQERTAELSRLNARLEATLSALPDILLEIDPAGRIYEWRWPESVQLPLTLEVATPQTLEEFLPFTAVQVLKEAVQRAARQGMDAGALFALPDGESLRWYELSVAVKPLLTATGNLALGEEPHFVVLMREVTARVEAERALRLSHQQQSVINALLRISLEDSPLEQQLAEALDELLTLPWLPLIPRGVIFLLCPETPGELTLVAQRGLSEADMALCQQVPLGTCLCGEAAQTRTLLFAPEVDERHTIRHVSFSPHGHYCVPLVAGATLLGLLTLYLQAGHQPRADEFHFLETVAQTLASLIEKKRAEQALRSSQRQYAALVNSIEGVVWEGDLRTGQITFVSHQITALLATPPVQWIGTPLTWAAAIHPEDREPTLAAQAAALAAKQEYELEYRMLKANGESVWVRDLVTLSLENDQPVKIRGIKVNITERKDLEKRLEAIYRLGRELTLLHDRQAVIRHMLEAASHVIRADWLGCGVVDEAQAELVYYWLSGAVERIPLKGLPTNAETALEPGSSFPLALLQTAVTSRVTRQAMREGGEEAWQVELCIPLRQGEQVLGILHAASRWAAAFSPADEQLLQTLADQTATALANAGFYTRLQQSARELETLNQAIHALAASLDIEQVLQQTLYEIKELLAAEDASVLLLTPDRQELVFAAVAGVQSAQLLLHYRFPAHQGVAGWVVQQGQAVLVPDTRLDPRFNPEIDRLTGLTTRTLLAVPLITAKGVIGVIEVINKTQGAFTAHDQEVLEALSSSAAIAIENAQLYQNLQNQYEALRQTQAQLIQSEKMSALGRLVASIAHEINNPLQSIQGCLALAGEELAEQRRHEKLEHYLRIADNEIERIAAIVQRVREFYRPASQTWQLTDIHAVLDSVLMLTHKQLQHSHVLILKQWSAGLPAIPANPDHLKQVFLNLVLNAVDAMPQGGTLEIGTALVADRIRITFRDTGIGMSPETLNRLFEPFFTTKPHGSGLGLSISYGIIQAHHGHIAVESEEGVGTTITLLLPLAHPEES